MTPVTAGLGPLFVGPIGFLLGAFLIVLAIVLIGRILLGFAWKLIVLAGIVLGLLWLLGAVSLGPPPF